MKRLVLRRPPSLRMDDGIHSTPVIAGTIRNASTNYSDIFAGPVGSRRRYMSYCSLGSEVLRIIKL